MHDKKPETTIERIGQVMSRHRVLSKSRLITRMTLGHMAEDMDMGYLDIVELVGRAGREGREVTVGTVADEMRIDPSRASRAVAHLVDRSLLQRGVSQEDARRAVLLLTDKGAEVLRDKIRTKLGLIEKILADWPDEDIDRFADLYARFLDDFERIAADYSQHTP